MEGEGSTDGDRRCDCLAPEVVGLEAGDRAKEHPVEGAGVCRRPRRHDHDRQGQHADEQKTDRGVLGQG